MDRLDKRAKEAKFSLLEKANQLAKFGEPHQKCGLIPVGKKVNILRDNQGEHSYSGLYSCRSGWCCPRCTNAKMAEKGRILRMVHMMITEPVRPTMLTYTLQHHKGERLADTMDVLKVANRVTRQGSRLARYNQLSYGYINTTEITWTHEAGWNPHQHEVNYFYSGVSDDDIRKYIIKPYTDAIEKSGRIIRDITVKIDKWDGGIDYLTKGSQIADELTLGNKKSSINIMKILGWAKQGNQWHKLYTEFCKATKRRKVVNMSTRLRQHYKIAEEKFMMDKKERLEDMTIAHSMELDEWYKLVKIPKMRYNVIATLDG